MRRICCVLIFLFVFGFEGFSQSSPPNLPHYDDKVLHFGVLLGFNQLSSNLIEKENRPYVDTVLSFESERKVGFQLGIISDLRLHKYARLRLTPTITFADRRIDYSLYLMDKYLDKSNYLEAIYLEVPLELKIQSSRWHNFRPYLIAGGKYAFDLGSIKRKKASPEDIMLKIDNNEWFYTLGVGFDFYLNYFKFGIELKTSFGLNDILIHEHHTMYSDVLDKIKTQVFFINLTFE